MKILLTSSFIIVFILLLFTSCFKFKYVANQTIVDKRDIQTLLEHVELNNFHSRSYNRRKYSIKKTQLKDYKFDRKKFKEIDKYKTGKLKGPFYEWDSTMYFLKKIETGEVYQYLFYSLNIHQSKSMSDEVFQHGIDSIKMECTKNNMTLLGLQREQTPGSTLKVPFIYKSKWTFGENLKPDFLAFMINNPPNAFFQTSKLKLSYTTYLSLLQKVAKNRKIRTLTYVKIRIKKIEQSR